MEHQDSSWGSRLQGRLLFALFLNDVLLPAAMGTLAPRPRDWNPFRWQKEPDMLWMSLRFPSEQGGTPQVRHSSCV